MCVLVVTSRQYPVGILCNMSGAVYGVCCNDVVALLIVVLAFRDSQSKSRCSCIQLVAA